MGSRCVRNHSDVSPLLGAHNNRAASSQVMVKMFLRSSNSCVVRSLSDVILSIYKVCGQLIRVLERLKLRSKTG